jgi:copper chaperone CopZ
MRYAKSFLVLIAILGISCASTTTTVQEDTSANYETRIYEVFGMDCPGCESGLCNLIDKIEAVHSSEASWKDKRLIVKVRPGQTLSDEDILRAITDANFTAGKRIKD